MTVECSKCGRKYDSALFQFGRTIDCACGSRVGIEVEILLPASGELQFFADVMLGRLARWLRALGINTAYEVNIEDGDLARRAIEENRFILTRDRLLPEQWRVKSCFLPASANPIEQLHEVVRHFNINRPESLFARCLKCNTKLREASATEIHKANAPKKIIEQHQTFRYCPTCHKLFWKGSHTERMQTVLESIFAQRKSE